MDEQRTGNAATGFAGPAHTGARRMTRPRSGRILGGVAAGLARHLRLDVTLVRVLVVVVTLVTSGLGLLAYGLLWLLVPSEDHDPGLTHAGPGDGAGRGLPGADPRGSGFWIGLSMVAVGALWLLSTGGAWFVGAPGAGGWLLPAALIGAGLALWLSEDRRDAVSPVDPGPATGARTHGDPTDPGAPSDPAGPGAPGDRAGPGTPGDPTGVHPVGVGVGAQRTSRGTGAEEPPAPPPVGQEPGGEGPPSGSEEPPPERPPSGGQGPPPGGSDPSAAAHGRGTPPPLPRERSPLTRVTLGLVLLVAGVAWFLGRAGLLEVGPRTVLAAALLVVGLGLLVGSLWGRARLLILAGVPLALLLVAALTTPFVAPPAVWPGTVGQSHLAVDDRDELRSSYEHGAGDLRLDLRDLELDRDAATRITLGAGQLQVVLPESLAVQVDARATVGEISLLGVRRAGLGPQLATRGAGEGGPTLHLELRLGAGEIDVRRAGEGGLRLFGDVGRGRSWFGGADGAPAPSDPVESPGPTASPVPGTSPEPTASPVAPAGEVRR